MPPEQPVHGRWSPWPEPCESGRQPSSPAGHHRPPPAQQVPSGPSSPHPGARIRVAEWLQRRGGWRWGWETISLQMISSVHRIRTRVAAVTARAAPVSCCLQSQFRACAAVVTVGRKAAKGPFVARHRAAGQRSGDSGTVTRERRGRCARPDRRSRRGRAVGRLHTSTLVPTYLCGRGPAEVKSIVCSATPSAILFRNATPSVFHQRHPGRVLRSS
jgi:hypothetical protein